MKKENWGKLAFTSVMGLILSSTFVFLAALPIRYTRLYFGRWVFLSITLLGSGLLFAFKQWQWAIVYLCLNLLIGSYRELEEKKLSIFISALVSIGGHTIRYPAPRSATTVANGSNFSSSRREWAKLDRKIKEQAAAFVRKPTFQR